MKLGPCKGCTDRTITCHVVCTRYQEWKKELEETKQWLNDQKPVTTIHNVHERNRQMKKKKSRKWNVKTRNGGDGRW